MADSTGFATTSTDGVRRTSAHDRWMSRGDDLVARQWTPASMAGASVPPEHRSQGVASFGGMGHSRSGRVGVERTTPSTWPQRALSFEYSTPGRLHARHISDDVDKVISHARAAGHELPTALYHSLDDQFASVRRLWDVLSLVRGTFSEDLLRHFDAPSLDDPAGFLLRKGLLSGGSNDYAMHHALRNVTQQSQSAHDHLAISGYYTQRSTDALDVFYGTSFEAYHHASSALNVDVVSHLTPLFAEQVWDFSDRLCEARLHHDARRYLQLVAPLLNTLPGRAGASAELHHRLAFSADGICDAPTAEMHYQLALEGEPRASRIHAHYICFLLDLGRIRESRAAWDRATAALPDPEDMDDEQVSDLYAQVAWRLIRTHELNFAEDVLSKLPVTRIDNLPALRTAHARLRALRLAQKYGPVRPFALLIDEWWKTPPRELPKTVAGQPLHMWWAGRITEIDDREVLIEIAEVSIESDEDPIPGTAELTLDEILASGLPDANNLSPGAFLVAGFYGENPDPVLRMVTPPDTLAGLPRPELDPQRYLKPNRRAA